MPLARLLTGLAAAAAVGAPALSARAETDAGAYLSARQAQAVSDFGPAAEGFARALIADPANTVLMRNATTAYVDLGDVARAREIAEELIRIDGDDRVASLVLFADMAKRGAWDAALEALDQGRSVGALFDGLMRAWALVGEGRMADAVAGFEEVGEESGVEAFGRYHQALARAQAGDFEAAEALLSGGSGEPLRLDRRGTIARIQILSQLGRNQDAVKVLTDTFGTELDPALDDWRVRLAAGETLPFDIATNAVEGMAEALYSIAGAVNGEAADAYTLLYVRLVDHLRPGHVDAALMTARLLEALGRHELATEVYRSVPREHPLFHAAEIGRAEALRRSDKTEAAIEVMRALQATHGDLPLVHISLGDTLRQLERYDEAILAYDRALELVETPTEEDWVVYFGRGIANERTDRWQAAEADFRRALELNPGQPQVLNYLGYSYVEMGENLEEALDMIERAVDARPNSGYITDSLGWALYRLGRYDEAIGHMERAVELMPVDPTLNDHLGDVLWAVGRKLEAEFQWERALSFGPASDEEAERIRRKIEVGLDEVLAEEGSAPLDVANEG